MRLFMLLSAVLILAVAAGCTPAAAPSADPTVISAATQARPTPASPTLAPSPTDQPRAANTPAPTRTPKATLGAAQDVMGFAPLGPIPQGRYFIDPDGDPSTRLRVTYDIPAKGWSNWIGAAKFSDAGNVGLSISTISNLVTDGCHEHTWADPPVGPSVDDLAVALTELEPFEVTGAPEDVSRYGYSGKHLTWRVPDLPVSADAFNGCTGGKLKSWVAFVDTEPGDAFYGYTGPGYVEEFWLLDVEGTRLMIAAEQSADSPAEDIAELEAILESIVIEP